MVVAVTLRVVKVGEEETAMVEVPLMAILLPAVRREAMSTKVGAESPLDWRILRMVEVATVARLEVPLPKRMALEVSVPTPVPPLFTAREPVQPGIKVKVLAVVVEILIWMLVSVPVATWIAGPVRAERLVKAEVK